MSQQSCHLEVFFLKVSPTTCNCIYTCTCIEYSTKTKAYLSKARIEKINRIFKTMGQQENISVSPIACHNIL